MTILVTGASGFLGGALVRALIRRSQTDIRCFIRARSRVAGSGIGHCQGSFSNSDDLDRALDGVDTVYHLAAAMRGAPAEMFKSTVVNSQRLIEAIARTMLRPKVVLVSSLSVYGIGILPADSLITEETRLEARPEQRDVYAHTKVWQEQIFWKASRAGTFPLIVARPGVIYGMSGAAISSRVGVSLFGVFLALGGDNLLPITSVDNCADAIAFIGEHAADGSAFNIVDDDPPRASDYLRRYRTSVKPLRVIPLPYPLALHLSRLVEAYADWSHGQLPALLTPYKVQSTWKRVRYDNTRLKALGWKQPVPTEQALAHFFHLLQEKKKMGDEQGGEDLSSGGPKPTL